MKLRELMLADMSSKQAYQAAMIQQHAASEAAAQRFFTYARQPRIGKHLVQVGITMTLRNLFKSLCVRERC